MKAMVYKTLSPTNYYLMILCNTSRFYTQRRLIAYFSQHTHLRKYSPEILHNCTLLQSNSCYSYFRVQSQSGNINICLNLQTVYFVHHWNHVHLHYWQVIGYIKDNCSWGRLVHGSYDMQASIVMSSKLKSNDDDGVGGSLSTLSLLTLTEAQDALLLLSTMLAELQLVCVCHYAIFPP